MIDEVPVYVRVAEALGRPADPRMLRDRKLLDALVAKNGITTRPIGIEAWETTCVPDITGEISGLGRTAESAIWNLVLKLGDAGKLERP